MAEDLGAVNLRWAWTLMDTLATAGVRHAVLSPGSRSTPLALACLRHPGLKSWVRVDERGAAYFALGMARAEGVPVAVVATSGTAVANWLPAVVEAHHARVPLILISADRPPELQNCGANQAMDQTHLFGRQVNAFENLPLPDPGLHDALRAIARRAMAATRWPCPGPVHLNQPFREPLVPRGPVELPPPSPVSPVPVPRNTLPGRAVNELAESLCGGRGLIVCGPGDFPAAFSEAIAGLAERLVVPVLADPLSGLRCGPHDRSRILTRYDSFLRDPKFVSEYRPEWVLRFGAFPISKLLGTYLESCERQWLVDPHGLGLDPMHRAVLIHADPVRLCRALAAAPAPLGWCEAFRNAESKVVTPARQAPLEATVVTALMELIPAGATLFVGNSLPVRDLDAFSGSRPEPLRVVGNRGASGIDGNLSTALGLAAAGGPVVALVGDLTCYHDLNALAGAAAFPLVLVVVNNGGGNIFRQLPQAGLPEFDEGWLTPVELDFSRVAALFGLQHARATSEEEFRRALADALEAPNGQLIEVVVDGAQSAARRRAIWEALKNAAPASFAKTPVD